MIWKESWRSVNTASTKATASAGSKIKNPKYSQAEGRHELMARTKH